MVNLVFVKVLKWDSVNGQQISLNQTQCIASNVFLIERIHNEYHVNAIFKYRCNEKRFAKNHIGIWLRETGFLYYNKLSLAKARSNLNGLELRVLYPFEYSNISHIYSESFYLAQNKSLLINSILFSLVAHRLNAVHVSSVSTRDVLKGQSFNYLPLNGTSFKKLLNGSIDAIGMSLALTTGRLPFFRYVMEMYSEEKAFILKIPTLAYLRNIYIMPFYKLVWYSLGCLLIINTVYLYFMEYISEKILAVRKLSFLDIIMVQCSALLQKSSNFDPTRLSSQIAIGSLYANLMMLWVAYTASLVVHLQVPATKLLNSYQNLIDSGVELGVEYHPLLFNYYQQLNRGTTDGSLGSSRKTHDIAFWKPMDGIQKMRSDFFAFELYLDTAYDIISTLFYENEKCSLAVVKSNSNMNDRYLLVAKNSSFAELFIIRKLAENGLKRREVLRYFHQKPKCEGGSVNSFTGIGIMETQFLFFIFLGGLLTSLVIFSFEHIVRKYSKHSHLLNRAIIYPYTE
ncbi:hypothetical protein GWI33_016876 [Rhynchophorus ferrugineus]|uniref:Ionotropic glutamate receptor C-terminal domain-containing protein n=1 Tax=Rhynchophorus ferrugineus TaxID=354439 RepID=A0A834HWL5_RHYFE|nr:hypothetical protein GWI33_016876 [Rhynchophorus ferrugineus]